MIPHKVICIILNYNRDDEAKAIAAQLDCPTIIVDSSGITKDGFITTDEPFWTGSFNKASEILINSGASHCLFICSDVKGDIQEVINRIRRLSVTIGIYSPAVLGQGWLHEKPQKYGLRDVPFCEGMIFCARVDVIRKIYPANAISNPNGFGVDIYMAYLASRL